MTECGQITLSEAVDLYFIQRGIDKKKHFVRYLVLAALAWEQLFMRTLWVQKSVWFETRDERGEIVIDVPRDNQRLLAVSVVNECGNIVPLFWNEEMNVVPVPKSTKSCGCKDVACDCGGTCADANALTVTTKLIFTINNVNYYEKQWTEICPNGDVLLWTETPTKKYNDRTGDGGDFNDDYNDDYSTTPAPMSDYDIVTVKTQKKQCALEVYSCGCPKETEANCLLMAEFCSCFLPSRRRYRDQCQTIFGNINDNHYGSVKVSQCGTKIIFKPSRKWWEATKTKYPKYLLVNYQTTGIKVGAETILPKIAYDCLAAILHYKSIQYNDRYSPNEKQTASWNAEHEKSKLIGDLNPVNLKTLSQIQDTPIRY